MAEIREVTDQSFDEEILQSDKPVVIDFWAEWCAPCRQIAPIVKQLAEEDGDQVVIAKMDVDSNQSTPAKYNVRAIPTLLAFKGGQVVAEHRGAGSKAQFEELVKNLL